MSRVLRVADPANHRVVEFCNRQRLRRLHLRRLRAVALGLLASAGAGPADLSVAFLDATAMTRANEEHLGHAGCTDVITFDYSDGTPPAAAAPLRGEILICVAEAVTQARHFQVPWQTEVVRYLVHGVLHLQGYDDHGREKTRRMKAREDELVAHLEQRFDLARIGE